MSDLTNHYFSLKKISRRQCKIFKNPWITRCILTSIKNKNKLHAKYLKNKSPELLSKYKKYRNKLTDVKERAKRSYFENSFQNARKSNGCLETQQRITEEN